ncbi:MAG: hypothetical protein IT448_07855 [Phycisphaerales bacterium]|nr:hypothetical protein [Phycisphaerales bacterium]
MTEPAARSRADIFNCPSCGQEIGVTLLNQPRVETCPHCHQPYIVPSIDGDTALPDVSASIKTADGFEIIDDTASTENDEETARRKAEDRENHLDGRHVALVAGQRRALNRARLFSLGFAIACIAGLIQIGLLVGRNPSIFQHRQRMMWLALMTVGLLYFVLWLLRRYARITRQLRQPPAPPPLRCPEFSTLQDGSQYWKNLDKM